MTSAPQELRAPHLRRSCRLLTPADIRGPARPGSAIVNAIDADDDVATDRSTRERLTFKTVAIVHLAELGEFRRRDGGADQLSVADRYAPHRISRR
jgi:hypothetical protein